MNILGVFIIVLVILLLWAIAIYNRFIKLKNGTNESYSGIDVQLKRRYDLIPNLIEVVKGYASHEEGTLLKVTEARNIAMSVNKGDIKAASEAENTLTSTLKTLFALAENYPELKANQNFLELQNSLSDIEDAIQNARRYYNAIVKDYNILCESFPSVIIASIFNFQKRDFFDIADNERENIKVKF
ncbi:MAG: LemA family protein [Bdellovibrionota bacterium]